MAGCGTVRPAPGIGLMITRACYDIVAGALLRYCLGGGWWTSDDRHSGSIADRVPGIALHSDPSHCTPQTQDGAGLARAERTSVGVRAGLCPRGPAPAHPGKACGLPLGRAEFKVAHIQVGLEGGAGRRAYRVYVVSEHCGSFYAETKTYRYAHIHYAHTLNPCVSSHVSVSIASVYLAVCLPPHTWTTS